MISFPIYKSTCVDISSTISLFVYVMFKQEMKNKTINHIGNTDCFFYFKYVTGECLFDSFHGPKPISVSLG